MKKEIEDAISELARQAKGADSAIDAMQLSQAVQNLASAYYTLSQ